MADREKFRIPVEKLKKVCDYEDELDFCSTSLDVEPFVGVIGQERAVRSTEFGLSMDVEGYNLFVAGPSGTGKSTYIQSVISKESKEGKHPSDWCYIHNFQEPERPIALELPAGQGLVFQKDIDELVSNLKNSIPKAFEGEEYTKQRANNIQDMQQKMEELFNQMDQEANAVDFKVEKTPGGLIIMPTHRGKPYTPEEYERLSDSVRAELDQQRRKLQLRIDEAFHESRVLEKEARVQIVELDKRITMFIVEPAVRGLSAKYGQFEAVVNYLETVLIDISEDYNLFRAVAAPKNQNMMQPAEEPDFTKYKVNLLVNNDKCNGAPVVTETNPHYYNLFGKIEYRRQMYDASTDFTMVKAGAIHRANGGYLVMQAKDVLTEPFVWLALKKALMYQQASIENIGEQYRYVPMATLRPEPIPLDLKVILIGSPLYYHILTMDEDFQKLFKVKVDFDTVMPRNKENIRQYVAFISSLCTNKKMKHFDRSGLAKIVEYGSWLTGRQNKLSTHFNMVSEIAYEAINLATREGAEYVGADHLDRAIEERKYRSSMAEEKYKEAIIQDQILIDTEGSEPGQINGLTIIQMGGYAFGRPVRITASTYIGRESVIDIERETKMSGTIHSKGVLTLMGYLGGTFAQNKPLGLTAQITFEQMYDGVDGDSASSAELYAILSSLADVPIRQGLAVTGSINQKGQIQPIAGVTQKIEGFFDICKTKGLEGSQGVIIPYRNIENLMLKDEVIEAVRKKDFHIYAVKDVREGIELLTGMEAGEIQEDGTYPERTLFGLVDQKLRNYDKMLMPEIEKPVKKVEEEEIPLEKPDG